MNNKSKIKRTTNRIIQGLSIIFLTKLLLLMLVAIFQSCESNGVEEFPINIEIIENEFSESLNISKSKISEIPLFKIKNYNGSSHLSRTIQPTNICLVDVESNSALANIQQLVESDNDYYLTDDNENTYEIETEYCFIVPIEPTNDALLPAIDKAKNYLRHYGYSNADIQYILDGEDESLLIPLVQNLIIVSNSYNTVNDMQKMGFYTLFGTTAHAAVGPPLAVQCAVEAIGLDIIYSAISTGIEKMEKKTLQAAVKKIAKRFLGPVGVAIAVAEFGWCMYVNS